MLEKLKMVGAMRLKVIHDNGNIELYEKKNLIVNNGLEGMANLLRGAGTGTLEVTNIGFGTNGTAPVGGDAGLTGIYSKVLDGSANPTLGQVEFYGSLGNGENNGTTIREYGLFFADNSLFARIVQPPVSKTGSIRLEIIWTITFSI